jgi:hypothetical protein
MAGRKYDRMPIEAVRRSTCSSPGDLDPIYIALHRAVRAAVRQAGLR